MKPITERIDSIYVNKKPSEFDIKYRHIAPTTIVVDAYSGNCIFPIAYVRKPKGISVKDWETIKEKLHIQLLK